MTTFLRLPRFTALATALVALSACDQAPTNDDDAFDIGFREDGRTGPGKLNTNFLGEGEDYPFSNLPLVPGGAAGTTTQLTEIRAYLCDVPGVGPMAGNFTTAGLPWELQIDDAGNLNTITMQDLATGTQCTIGGTLWENTYWEVSAEYSGTTITTDLWLRDVETDANGNTLYEWQVNFDRVTGNIATGAPDYRPTCDEDPEPDTPNHLRYHAYLVPGVTVDMQTGDFSASQVLDQALMACVSSGPGKSVLWGYAPWTFDNETHELATRMVRADYCGDGVSHTETGTNIWLQSTLGIDVAPAPVTKPVEWRLEAVWNVDDGRASCFASPRLDPNSAPATLACPNGPTLPKCKASHFNAPGAIMITHGNVNNGQP